ncbi:hypothetical protein OROGR_031435 [Orobanche gracilis]
MVGPKNYFPPTIVTTETTTVKEQSYCPAGCDGGDHRHAQFPASPISQSNTKPSFINSHAPITCVPFRRRRPAAALLPLENSRNSFRQARPWGSNLRTGMVMGDYGDDDDDGDEEDEDRSLDLLIRFVENVFRKVSRKARKAVKSVLPVPISTRLYDLCSKVGFAVNGTLILTFLWVLKAFLENVICRVICNLGSVVFASILLIRGIWTGISYFQEGRGYRADDDEPRSWTRTQPAI